MNYIKPNRLIGLQSAQYQLAKEQHLLNFDIPVKERTKLTIIKKNLFTVFNFINIFIAILLLIAQSYRNMLFLSVVIINTCIGIYQELKAKQMSDKLSLLSKNTCTCIRDDAKISVLPDQIALYDLLILKRGDQVPADCIVEDGTAMLDESLLTGESDAISKAENAMLYGGSFVQEGLVYARVIAVAQDCYIKKLQLQARQTVRPKSKLLAQMQSLIRYIGFIILPIGLLLLYKSYTLVGSFQEAIPQVAAALIGMIPSGLFLLCSVALAVGVIHLAEDKVMVNELNAIENLARVDTLCLDKTGTITSGAMQFEKLIPLSVTEEYAKQCLQLFLENKAENTDTSLALKQALQVQANVEVDNPYSIPFNSERKWSSAFVQEKQIVLGAVNFLTADPNIIQQANDYSRKAFRVLLLAETNQQINPNSDLIQIPLQSLALILLNDTLRENIENTISYFYQQGVDIKVISGDNVQTVSAVADKVGIRNAFCNIDLSTAENTLNSVNYTVFARVKPEIKKHIVQLLRNEGKTVAMTGDGINDLPALKIAHCSIAMGSGNDATKKVSQIVLLQNNFSVMPKIVNEGRRIINNINLSASLFINKTVLSILLSIFSILFSFVYPFQPIQLTLIATLTIGVPSFLLTFEKNYQIVKGNIFESIFNNSIPTGITVAIALAIVQKIYRVLEINPLEIPTVSTLLAGGILFVSLIKIASPLNVFRFTMVLSLLACFMSAFIFLRPVFFFVSLPMRSIFILVVLFICSVLLFVLLQKLTLKCIQRWRKSEMF